MFIGLSNPVLLQGRRMVLFRNQYWSFIKTSIWSSICERSERTLGRIRDLVRLHLRCRERSGIYFLPSIIISIFLVLFLENIQEQGRREARASHNTECGKCTTRARHARYASIIFTQSCCGLHTRANRSTHTLALIHDCVCVMPAIDAWLRANHVHAVRHSGAGVREDDGPRQRPHQDAKGLLHADCEGGQSIQGLCICLCCWRLWCFFISKDATVYFHIEVLWHLVLCGKKNATKKQQKITAIYYPVFSIYFSC